MKEFEKHGTKFKIWEEEVELPNQSVVDGEVVNKKVKKYWQEVHGIRHSITEADYLEKMKNVEEVVEKPKTVKKSGKKKK